MALLNIWEGSRGIMRLLVIQFVCWLGCFSTFALAQFDISEGVTGSVTFPALGITCVSNLAVFVTTLIRGRLDLEIGARDVIEILLTPKLEEIKGIEGYGLTTCIQGNATETATSGGGVDVGVASSEGVLQAPSTGENDAQTASTGRGRETASAEENVPGSPREGGGIQTISTEETVIHIDSAEGRVGSTEQEDEEIEGLKAAGVIILSNGRPSWSMRQFIKSNAHVVDSIILQFLPLHRARDDAKLSGELTAGVTIGACVCRESKCNCIVFGTVKQITSMLVRRMPGTLKPLTDSLCLLPCSTCLRKGCHECNRENLLRAESEADEGQPMRQRVVSDILDNIRAGDIPAGKPIGICIPMNDAHGDDWTKLLLKSLRSKDAEGRGITNKATEALEGYLGGGRGSEEGIVEYDIFSFVVPRLTEILINLVLTFWFRVDAFSSALLARRTVRDYLVDTKSSGFAANAFLTEALVKSNADNTQVCQVLTFRGRDWLCIITFISVGCVNVICALGWSLLITFEGGPDTSQPPSLPRVAVIIAAIGSPWLVFWLVFSAKLAVGIVARGPTLDETDNTNTGAGATLDETDETDNTGATLDETDNTVTVQSFVLRFLDTVCCMTVWLFVLVFVVILALVVFVVIVVLVTVYLVISPGLMVLIVLIKRRNQHYTDALIATGSLLEMACLVSWSALAGALGIKGFGRWLYAALQILIWLKWATGSYFLSQENSLEYFWDFSTSVFPNSVFLNSFFGNSKSSEFFGRIPDRFFLILYSSAFWLNAVLAGVRCKWEAWPWKHNHLFSFVSQ